jgi:putative transposase
LVELAREKPRFGYRRLHVLLQRGGTRVNHKRVHRVYREAGLLLRRKKRKHCVRVGQPLLQRTAANQEWALDFAHDAVECGRAIRVLSVVDAYTRECPALEVDTSFASRRVTRVLEDLIVERGIPGALRCDNVLTAERYKEVRAKISCASDFRRDCSLNPSGFHRQQEWHSTIATQGPLELHGLYCT